MPYEVKGKCIYKKDGGTKVGCTKGSVKKYLAALHANADENTETEKEPIKELETENINETTKDLIKRLIRENIGLEKPTSPSMTFNIKEKGDIVGKVVVAQAEKTFGRDTLEITNIHFNKGVINLEIGKKTLIAIFEAYPDINRILIQPQPESRDFWFKLDAQRINDDFMIIFRAH